MRKMVVRVPRDLTGRERGADDRRGRTTRSATSSVGSAQPQPGFLHHSFCVDPGAEHPVGEALQAASSASKRSASNRFSP